ncbi:uncharacterized protein PG986_002761 [Apiospora aurea]|uniref:Uncharacterized protein n=1 Tax=Apiospora aurea TaxID=335848 RepID=A0ABR1QPS2_9PEZI
MVAPSSDARFHRAGGPQFASISALSLKAICVDRSVLGEKKTNLGPPPGLLPGVQRERVLPAVLLREFLVHVDGVQLELLDARLDRLGAGVLDGVVARDEVRRALALVRAERVGEPLQLEDGRLELGVGAPDAAPLKVQHARHGVHKPAREGVAVLLVPVRRRLRPGDAVDGPEEGDQLVLEERQQQRQRHAAALLAFGALQADVEVAVRDHDGVQELQQVPGGLFRHPVLFSLQLGREVVCVEIRFVRFHGQSEELPGLFVERIIQNRETLVEAVGELVAKHGHPSVNRLVHREGAESSRHLCQPLEDVPALVVLVRIAYDLSSLAAYVIRFQGDAPGLVDNLHYP